MKGIQGHNDRRLTQAFDNEAKGRLGLARRVGSKLKAKPKG
jgi:hypothetical protein